jgi:hypothetical protein
MRRHLWFSAACALLLTWSGLVSADQTLGGDDRVNNCAWQETLWALGSIHEECLSDAEDPDQGVDEDEDPVDPTADWA